MPTKRPSTRVTLTDEEVSVLDDAIDYYLHLLNDDPDVDPFVLAAAHSSADRIRRAHDRLSA